MLSVRRGLSRLFTDPPKFADRWSAAPTVSPSDLPKLEELPKYRVSLDPSIRIPKERVFDIELPVEMRLGPEMMQIWAMADGQFSVNGTWIRGSILAFRDVVFQWDVQHPDQLHDYHLDIIRYMRPRIDYVIIGTGKLGKTPISQPLLRRYQSVGISIYMSATFEACGTFNLASEDRRNVCAALIPSNIE